MKITESSIYDPSPDLDYYVRLIGHHARIEDVLPAMDVFVLSSHRGRGIGTHLAHWVQDLARSRGVAVLGMPVPEGSAGDRLLAALGYGLAAFTKPVFPLAPTVDWVVAARFISVCSARRSAVVMVRLRPASRGRQRGGDGELAEALVDVLRVGQAGRPLEVVVAAEDDCGLRHEEPPDVVGEPRHERVL